MIWCQNIIYLPEKKCHHQLCYPLKKSLSIKFNLIFFLAKRCTHPQDPCLLLKRINIFIYLLLFLNIFGIYFFLKRFCQNVNKLKKPFNQIHIHYISTKNAMNAFFISCSDSVLFISGSSSLGSWAPQHDWWHVM